MGDLEGVRVAVFGGGRHYYETGDPAAMRLPLEVLKALGAEALIATNAAGSLRADIRPGDLMLRRDHINFSGLNPLIGEPTDARFVPMTDAHDPALRAAADAPPPTRQGVTLPEGVYCWYSGPSFETPAEIRAICKPLGGDAVGMSTVPEVILARLPWAEGRGDFYHHQHGGRPVRRKDQPRAHQGDGAVGCGKTGTRCCAGLLRDLTWAIVTVLTRQRRASASVAVSDKPLRTDQGRR